jgi:hypothetical protein
MSSYEFYGLSQVYCLLKEMDFWESRAKTEGMGQSYEGQIPRTSTVALRLLQQ